MKLAAGNKLKSEEYQDAGEWFPRLARFINVFLEQIYVLLSNRLTIKDNFDGQITEVVLDGTFPVKFAWNATSRPVAIIPGKLARVDGLDVSLAAAYSIDWSYADGSVSIAATPGLTSSSANKYYLTLVGFGG